MSAFQSFVDDPDVILVSIGIMSANLGVMLKRLEPQRKIQIFEITMRDCVSTAIQTTTVSKWKPRKP